jgi:acetyltransferase
VTDAADREDKETLATLPEGQSIRIRRLRPEDERLLVEFVARILPEDLRLRFFTAARELPHDMIARLARVDFARDMALVARPPGNDEILGVARYMSDLRTREAEFGVIVRSDLKGHGIGWMLMKRLVEVARRRGIKKLTGLVLVENTDMLKFCRELGFSVARNPVDPMTVNVSLTLA